MEIQRSNLEKELLEIKIEKIWEIWNTGFPGIDFPETFNPWDEEQKLRYGTCPECGLPRGDVREPRCSTCIGDNFMEPL